MASLLEVFEEAAAMSAPLSERLAHFDQALRSSGLEWSEAYDEMVARLRVTRAGSSAPGIGELFPDFILPDERGRLVNSQELLASGPLVVSFNRGHWCEFCQLELRALQQIAPLAAQLGASIVAITPELAVYSASFKSANGLSFPVLCDVDLGTAMALGLAVPIGERVADLLARDGIYLSKVHGGMGLLLPIPATFVVASDSRIIARYVDADFRQRMDVAETLAALEGN